MTLFLAFRPSHLQQEDTEGINKKFEGRRVRIVRGGGFSRGIPTSRLEPHKNILKNFPGTKNPGISRQNGVLRDSDSKKSRPF